MTVSPCGPEPVVEHRFCRPADPGFNLVSQIDVECAAGLLMAFEGRAALRLARENFRARLQDGDESAAVTWWRIFYALHRRYPDGTLPEFN
jgi:hypothetical protein